MAGIDLNNSNNHAGIARVEATEKIQSLLRLINNYRLELRQYESVRTENVLIFLNNFEKQLNENYEKELANGERDKLKEEYFLLTKKKPFGGWTDEQIRQKIEEEKAKNKSELSENYLEVKKSQWKK